MIIAVDFDGTCVTHRYPEVGEEIGAPPVLRRLVKKGHKLILYTMRSGETLTAAEQWFAQHKIPLHSCNCNPEQHAWTSSPKVYAQLYIDDAALGCPLVTPAGERPYVDWTQISRRLEEMRVLDS